MGHKLPPEPPVLLDEKWYYISAAAFAHILPGCIGDPTPVGCCKEGSELIAYLKDPQCVNGAEICIYTGYTAQRVYNISGPYDSWDECDEAGDELFGLGTSIFAAHVAKQLGFVPGKGAVYEPNWNNTGLCFYVFANLMDKTNTIIRFYPDELEIDW